MSVSAQGVCHQLIHLLSAHERLGTVGAQANRLMHLLRLQSDALTHSEITNGPARDNRAWERAVRKQGSITLHPPAAVLVPDSEHCLACVQSSA